MARTRALICPYCGETQPETSQCRACRSSLDGAARRERHNAMGPWFIRDENHPFLPGCSYEEIVRRVEAGSIDRYTLMRGPTTRQLWTIAKRIPGIAHLLGYCHQCGTDVDACDHGCHSCGARFGAFLDRNFLGLPEVDGLDEWSTRPNADDQIDLAASSSQPLPAMPHQPATPVDSGRISSFASDSELTGDDQSFAPAVAPSTATATPAESPAVATAPRLQTDSETSPHAVYASASTRALQRRIAHEQRRVRLLIGISLISVASLAVVVIMQGMGAGGAAPGVEQSTEDSSDDAATNTNPAPMLPGNIATPPADESASDENESAAPAEPPVNDEAAAELEQLLQDARVLLAAGMNDDHPDEAQIRDLETAIGLFEQVLAQLPDNDDDAARREMIRTQLGEARRELERLELRTFFGDDD